MSKPHRISVGGLVFRGGRVLLVRYPDLDGGTFLVGPGGGVEDEESLFEAVVREMREETGIVVEPMRIAIVEDDIPSERFKTCKIWMTCRDLGGEICRSAESDAEGILEAVWLTAEQVAQETVYPATLQRVSWELLRSESWMAEYLSRS